jgi:DNA-binding transcriptional MerR regulator
MSEQAAYIGRRGLRRQFAADVLERLALIVLARAASFSLDEIGLMLTPKATARSQEARRQGRRARQDDSRPDRDARQPAARRCLRGAHQMECPNFAACCGPPAAGAMGRPGKMHSRN